MAEEKEKSVNREEVCKTLAHIRWLQKTNDDVQKNITFFYTLIKTHPNYNHNDDDVRRLELFLRDVVNDEVEANNEAIDICGKTILEYVKE